MARPVKRRPASGPRGLVVPPVVPHLQIQVGTAREHNANTIMPFLPMIGGNVYRIPRCIRHQPPREFLCAVEENHVERGQNAPVHRTLRRPVIEVASNQPHSPRPEITPQTEARPLGRAWLQPLLHYGVVGGATELVSAPQGATPCYTQPRVSFALVLVSPLVGLGQ